MSTLPSTTNATILAVGAAGHFAGLVLPELAKRDVKVRGLIQDMKQGDAVIKNGASEVAAGNLNDRASLDEALKGIDSVFYISPISLADEVETGKRMVEAARQAGVRRFVFSSLIHPIISAMSHHIAKAQVEEAILASDMEFTFLHPAMFFQNYAAGWAEVVKTKVLTEPWSPDTCFSKVDYRDVAEVAAIALTEDRLKFGTFELCSEGYFNRKDVASLISEILGTKIETGNIVPAQPADEAKTNNNDIEKQVMKPMIDWYNMHGLVGNSLILRAILNREPRTLRAYFKELAS